jgi:hypothetical protein
MTVKKSFRNSDESYCMRDIITCLDEITGSLDLTGADCVVFVRQVKCCIQIAGDLEKQMFARPFVITLVNDNLR